MKNPENKKQKKEYTRPVLTQYGIMEKVTLGSGVGGADGGTKVGNKGKSGNVFFDFDEF